MQCWKRSGLSIAEFCRREKLSLHCFYFWRREFGETVSLKDFNPLGRLAVGILQADVEDFQALQPLCQSMLDQEKKAKAALAQLGRTVCKFRKKLLECRDHVDWAKGARTEGFFADELAQACEVSPAFLEKIILEAMPQGKYTNFLLRLPGWSCPLCRQEPANHKKP